MKSSAATSLHSFLACLGLLAIAVFVQLYNDHARTDDEPYAHVDGYLREWGVVGLPKRTPALRFTLREKPIEFRVDPSLVRRFVSDDKRPLLQPDIRISVTVSEAELNNPSNPIIGPDEAIVWVHGLKLGNEVLFSPQDERELWRRDNTVGVLGIVASLLGALYYGLKWRWSVAAA